MQNLSFQKLFNALFTSVAVALVVITTGCATNTGSLIIDPDIQLPTRVLYVNKQAQFGISDLRAQPALMIIRQEGKANKTIPSQTAMTDVIANSVADEFKKQGIEFNGTSQNSIDIKIDNAQINVTQHTFSYEATTTITLIFVIDNEQQTLTQTFNNTSTSTGPFKADIPILETNFNRQLNKVITDALNNEKIIAFISAS